MRSISLMYGWHTGICLVPSYVTVAVPSLLGAGNAAALLQPLIMKPFSKSFLMPVQAMMYRDGSGRLIQLADSGGDAWKADLSRTYAMAACACPPSGPPGDGAPTAAPAPAAPLSHRELFRMILQNIRCARPPPSGC